MAEERVDILGLLDVAREEVFASSSNAVLVYDKNEPLAYVYYKDGHFAARFGSPTTRNIME